jgi:hypothetical protein
MSTPCNGSRSQSAAGLRRGNNSGLSAMCRLAGKTAISSAIKPHPAIAEQERAEHYLREAAQEDEREVPGQVRRHDSHVDFRVDEVVHAREYEEHPEDVARHRFDPCHSFRPPSMRCEELGFRS